MPIFTTDLVECLTLAHRILRDEPLPDEIDAICFFGQTEENDHDALRKGSDLWFDCQSAQVLVGQCDRIERENGLVVRGSDAWVKELEGFGVDSESIQVYPMSDKFPPSTDAEAWGMVPLIKENGWKRLVVTVPPLHAIRAFVSLVSACLKNGLDDVGIWSAPSAAPPWNESVFHSGSMPSATRVSHIAGELAKIFAYCAKGDHPPAQKVLEYLNHRDTVFRGIPFPI